MLDKAKQEGTKFPDGRHGTEPWDFGVLVATVRSQARARSSVEG